MYLDKPLLEFDRVYVSNEELPNLIASAHKWSSVFGSTYLCEKFFYNEHHKSRYRSRLTDENLSMQLRVATSSVRPNIKRLVKQKSFQISHWVKNSIKCFFVIFYYFMPQYCVK